MATATEPVSGQKEVTVSLKKLTEGVGTVFAGVIQMLEALDASTAAVFAEKLKEGAEAEHETEAAKPHDPAVSDDAAGNAADPVAEEPASAVTVDDITKVIVAKIKQKRSNNEVIAKLLKTYKVEKVSELKPSQYEAFLTDISQI